MAVVAWMRSRVRVRSPGLAWAGRSWWVVCLCARVGICLRLALACVGSGARVRVSVLRLGLGWVCIGWNESCRMISRTHMHMERLRQARAGISRNVQAHTHHRHGRAQACTKQKHTHPRTHPHTNRPTPIQASTTQIVRRRIRRTRSPDPLQHASLNIQHAHPCTPAGFPLGRVPRRLCIFRSHAQKSRPQQARTSPNAPMPVHTPQPRPAQANFPIHNFVM